MSDESTEIIQEAFADVLTHLVGAVSAYEQFAGNSDRPGKRDALYLTRLSDFQKAIERGRNAYRSMSTDPNSQITDYEETKPWLS